MYKRIQQYYSDSTQENGQCQEQVVLIYTVKDIIGNGW